MHPDLQMPAQRASVFVGQEDSLGLAKCLVREISLGQTESVHFVEGLLRSAFNAHR